MYQNRFLRPLLALRENKNLINNYLNTNKFIFTSIIKLRVIDFISIITPDNKAFLLNEYINRDILTDDENRLTLSPHCTTSDR